MQSIVEVVCVGGGTNKTYNSVYNDPGYTKMVIVQDDDKFPSPRLCLLRRWPNFEGGFGFNLYEDLGESTDALKVEEVVRNSPAEAGGLRKNDVIIEINRDNIECLAFLRLVEILKEACNQSEMELLVLTESDARWYRERKIFVNSHFPNIEYCETPFYGHMLKPLEAVNEGNTKTNSSTLSKMNNSQIEFHSSTGKLYRTTLVIDKEKDSVYRRIEELPSSETPSQSADQLTVPPLRPDGSYRHPSSEPGSVRVYYRRDKECLNTTLGNGKGDEINNATADSGHGSIRRSTPLSTNAAQNIHGMSPYSTLGKSYGEQATVDLLHDKWADLMDKYLDTRFRSSSAHVQSTSINEKNESIYQRDASTGKRNKPIRLHDPNVSTTGSKKSRCQSPNDGSFSYLYSGRDDFQSASATSFKEINRQSTSPYHHLAQQYQRAPHRYPSPHHSVTSPTRHVHNRPQSQTNRYSNVPAEISTSASSSPLFQQYESSTYSTHTSTQHQQHVHKANDQLENGTFNSSRSESSSSRQPQNIAVKSQKSQINSLGFQLNEPDIIEKGCYIVKYVDPHSASSMAGLKEGDKITKINGKTTLGMSYEQFCYEIVVAQQQQQKNNMIHLMVMRRSTKVNVHSSTTASSISNLSGPTVLPIKNNYEQKTTKTSILSTSTSSNLADEGYVPGSATSATSSATTTTANVSSTNIPNTLVSVVKVTSTSPTEEDVFTSHQSRPKTPPQKPKHSVFTEEPAYVLHESKVQYKPNIIYDNEEVRQKNTLRFLPAEQNESPERREKEEREQYEREQLEKREREKQEREQYELETIKREMLERERREQYEREQQERDQKERAQREQRENFEREQREQREIEFRAQREQEQRERENREHLKREAAREKREREEAERLKREQEHFEQERLEDELRQKEMSQLKNREKDNDIKTALAALTSITVIGSEPISADTYHVKTHEEPEKIVYHEEPERVKYQVNEIEAQVTHQTTRYPIIVDEVATTTMTKSVNEVERVRDEHVEEHTFPEPEFTTTTSQYMQDSQEMHIVGEDQKDLTNEEKRAHHEFAGNYSNGLVYNALRQLEISENEIFGGELKDNSSTFIERSIERPSNYTISDMNLNKYDTKSEDIRDNSSIFIERPSNYTISDVILNKYESKNDDVRDNSSIFIERPRSSSSYKLSDVVLDRNEDLRDNSSTFIERPSNYTISDLVLNRNEDLRDNSSNFIERSIERPRSRSSYKLSDVVLDRNEDLRDNSSNFIERTIERPSSYAISDVIVNKYDPKDNDLRDISSTFIEKTIERPSSSYKTDDENHIEKIFVFKKSLNQEKLALKRQIMSSLNREELDLEDLSSLSDISEFAGPFNNDNIDKKNLKFDEPFSIGIHLQNKVNPLEIGEHLIDYVEAGSAADRAGIRAGSKLTKINEVYCVDKTHEFVMFYLNYVLRKMDIETVELLVKEPFVLPAATNLTTSTYSPMYSRIQNVNETFTDDENRFLKAIVSSILSGAASEVQKQDNITYVQKQRMPQRDEQIREVIVSPRFEPSASVYTSSTDSFERPKYPFLRKIVLEATDYQPELMLPHLPAAATETIIVREIVNPYSSSSSFRITPREDPAVDQHRFETQFTSSSSNLQPSYRAEPVKPSNIFNNEYTTMSTSSVAKNSNIENLKVIILEATDYHPTVLIPSREATKSQLTIEPTRSETESGSLQTALMALTQLTALGGAAGSSGSKLDMIAQEDKFNRQQEVMSHLVQAFETKPSMAEKTRTCKLYNSEHFFGYGIAFHTEDISISKPHHKLVYPLIEIEANSPAEDAGLQNYQRVVAVNGKYVNKEFGSLEDVVQSIEDSYYSRDNTEITVIDSEFWNALMENPQLAASLATKPVMKSPSESKIYADRVIDQIITTKPKPYEVQETYQVTVETPQESTLPRLCRLARDNRTEQYGFDFKTIKIENKHVANNVRPGLPASRAGLKEGDYILEVNGESVDGVEHDQVVNKISAHGTQVDLLAVSDLESYNRYRDSRKQPEEIQVDISSVIPNAVINQNGEEVTLHSLKLIPGFKGLGISLNKNAIISSVDPDSPAENAGLRKDQQVVQVNGKSVQNKSYKEIAKAIKEHEKDLTIGVIDVTPQRDVPVQHLVEQTQATVGTTSLSSNTGKAVSDQVNSGIRVCSLINRPDFNGYGFSMRSNEKGAHQISNVEMESPAEMAGLKSDDFLIKVNDINVVGERYNKTVALIKNESDKGRLRLEVVEPALASYEIRNVELSPTSGYSTLPAKSSSLKKKDKHKSIDNLRNIADEITQANKSNSFSDHSRAQSADAARKYSTINNSTWRSVGSTATGFTDSNYDISSAKSVTNLSGTPKFKRCNVQLLHDFQGYGFTLNSKSKPKYMIYTIDTKSPAYKANLRETDVIVQIDKKNIRRLKFDKVKEMLSESLKKGQVEILAINKEGYMYYKNKKKRFSSNKLVTAANTEPYYTLGGYSGIQEAEISSELEERPNNENTDNIEIPQQMLMDKKESSGKVHQAPSPFMADQTKTGTDFDNHEIIMLTLTHDKNKSLGLALKPNRSSSLSSTKSNKSKKNKKDDQHFPIVTTIDKDSPAEHGGLRSGDNILEINGKPTNGLSSKKIAELIKSSGEAIEILIKREKKEDEIEIDNEQLRQNADIIASTIIDGAKARVPEYNTDTLNSSHSSRKDSVKYSHHSQHGSEPGSPQIVNSEIRISSSKLQDAHNTLYDRSSTIEKKTRNQSEPAPIQKSEELISQQEEDYSRTTPKKSHSLSKRSQSSFNIPHDAPVPRLCRVRAYEENLGFTVSGSKSNKGVYKVNDIAPNSPAAHSGLKGDDHIIEVSGKTVDSMSYQELVEFIKAKKQEDDLQLLVADRSTLNWYKSKNLAISSQMITKMQYIETLLKDELQDESHYDPETCISTKNFKIPIDGRAVMLDRKIYLSKQFVEPQ